MENADFPSSVLFCCDYNSIRSPMAEALMKRLYGHRAYVQSAGVKHDLEIDGFAVSVCAELGVALERHRVRSFDEMEQWGDDLSGFDLIVSLSPASQRRALELTRHYHLAVEYWAILDPSGLGETREDKLASYRQARDQIIEKIRARFGPSTEEPLAGP
ncbi:MAG: low molecular weight phosphatase family protein [Pseudomonadota bacterium]